MSSDSILSFQIKHRIGAVSLDAAFTLTQPWTVLFGPSGSGKTTILRAIAGLIEPDSGRIVYGENILFDHTARVSISPHQRPIRTAAQRARLFPHMTVQQNLLFGTGWPSKPGNRLKITHDVMTGFHIANLAAQKPHQLSGGEQQRAAVARALIAAITFDGPGQPLLLLDEPLSGLGANMRDDLLGELKTWVAQWKIPMLSVTHDISEAFQLRAEVIKIAEGRVIQQGPVETVLAEERTALLNLLSGARSEPSRSIFP